MAQVYPFPAYRYNGSRVAFDHVLTQPYDKISPAAQEKYYAADPHNLIAVEKGRVFPGDAPGHNVYTRAAEALESWIRDHVVAKDSEPSFYAYTQEYSVPGTEERRTRRGFIGAGKLEEYSAGVVFRHEHTLSGPKADRLEMLRHTKTHTGQLLCCIRMKSGAWIRFCSRPRQTPLQSRKCAMSTTWCIGCGGSPNP